MKEPYRRVLSLLLLASAFMLCGMCLRAQNLNNPNKQGPLGIQVNTMTGNVFIPRTDIRIPSRFFDLNIKFYYNSYLFNTDQGFGNGWTFYYNIRYRHDTIPGARQIFWGDGREDRYDSIGGGAYQPPRGFFNTLKQYEPGKYELTLPDGVKYFFDNAVHKRVTKMTEPNGNSINFNYTDSLLTSIANSAGQSITLTYAAGRLSAITDAINTPVRIFNYKYDANGNLKEVNDPLNGQYRYTYLVNGPMKTLSDRNGNTVDLIYYPDLTARELIGCNKRMSFSYDTLSQTTIVTDHLDAGNQVTKYTYQTLDNISWITSIQGNCCGFNLHYDYDDQGNRIKMTDANGDVYTYTYDSRGNMLTATDPLGRVDVYTYTTDFNKINSYIDPRGNKFTLTYDAKGNLATLVTPGNQTFTASRNAKGDITSSTDPLGNTYTYSYDTWGNPVSVTGPNGYNALLSFDGRGNLLSYRDARGNTSMAEYDILNRLKKITDPINHSLKYAYDAAGNLTSFINQNNETSSLGYDASNRVVKTTDPMGNIYRYSYDAMDNLLSVTNPLGYKMVMTYDKLNRLKTQTDAEGNTISVERDGNGKITSAMLPNGRNLSYFYDRSGRLVSINDEEGMIAGLTYDKNNNLVSYTNGTNAAISATYDEMNRITRITDPLGNSRSFTYDKNNRVVTTTDREGHTRAFTYDGLNRIKTYTDNTGAITTLEYDAAGNITSLKDQNNNTTTYIYDELNRRKRMTFSNNTYAEFGYDSRGNVISIRQTDGTNVSYEYDALNRIVSRTLSGGEKYSFTYDRLNRVLSATNNNGTISFTYDALNRVASETYDGRTTTYIYSISGRTQTSVYPDNSTVTREFDSRNRLIKILRNNELVAEYAYNGADQIASKKLSNGTSSLLQYDFANRLSNLSITGASGEIQQKQFQYDKEYNRTGITRVDAPLLSEQYGYDAAYRLTSYRKGLQGNFSVNNTYTYDAAGNRTAASLNGVSKNYTVNGLNQTTGINGISTVFDGRGNLTYDGTFYKTYDGENRLVKDSSNPSNVIRYGYDAVGRRVLKELNGTLYKYSYSGPMPIEERNSAGLVLNSTVFGGFLAPVLIEKGGNKYYYHQGELNSVEALTNDDGRLVEKYEYDVYGGLRRLDSLNNPLGSSLTGNRFGFTGQEYDSATASYRFFYRTYAPETGLFGQRDPLEYEDATGMYQYVGNNPANGIDIWGLQETSQSCPMTKTQAAQDVNDFVVNSMFSGDLMAKGISALESGLGSIIDGAGGTGGTGTALGFVDLGLKGVSNYNTQTNGNSTYMERVDANYDVVGSGGGLLAGIGAAAMGGPAGLAVGAGTGIVAVGDYVSSKTTGKNIRQHLEGPMVGHGEFLNSKEGFEQWAREYGVDADIFDYESSRPGFLQEGDQYQFIKNLWEHDKQTTYLMWRRSQNLYFNIEDGCGGGTRIKVRWVYDHEKQMWVLVPQDPNLIIGPEGKEEKKWVAVKDRLPYTILFENDSNATARARYVRITSDIQPKQDPATLELGSVGFNNLSFEIPAGRSSYYQRLDAIDSTGVFVDLTAGYDVMTNKLFWEFRAIDPTTLMPPDDPLAGFLLLQDSAQPNYGNGFVNFSIRARADAITRDTIAAAAEIVFDENEMIPTNIHTNTLDAFAPSSRITAISVTDIKVVNLSWTGTDDAGGSGIDHYTLYVSEDGVNYTVLAQSITRTDTSFSLPVPKEYCFFVTATDKVGNVEQLDISRIQCSSLTSPLPVTWLSFTGKTEDKDNLLDWSTASEQESKEFRVERSLNGSDFVHIGTVAAAGNSASVSSYSFRDKGIDKLFSPVMYYRLKQVDVNGNFKYSNTIRLQYNSSFAQSVVYPNPSSGWVTITVGDRKLIGTQATVTDMNGRLLNRITIQGNSQSLDLSGYVNGVYIIKLSNNETLKVIKQ